MDSRNLNSNSHTDSFRLADDVIEEERDEFNLEEQTPVFRPRQASMVPRASVALHRKGSIKASATMDDAEDDGLLGLGPDGHGATRRPSRRASVGPAERRVSHRRSISNDSEQMILNQVRSKYTGTNESQSLSENKKRSHQQIRKMMEDEAKEKKSEKEVHFILKIYYMYM